MLNGCASKYVLDNKCYFELIKTLFSLGKKRKLTACDAVEANYNCRKPVRDLFCLKIEEYI